MKRPDCPFPFPQGSAWDTQSCNQAGVRPAVGNRSLGAMQVSLANTTSAQALG